MVAPLQRTGMSPSHTASPTASSRRPSVLASTVRFLGMTKFLFHQLKSEDDKYDFALVKVFPQSACASQSNSAGNCLHMLAPASLLSLPSIHKYKAQKEASEYLYQY